MGPTCALEAFDVNNVPLQFFLKVVSSPADVAEKADRIITMLPTSINAVEAYSGANGILKYVFLSYRYVLSVLVCELHICYNSCEITVMFVKSSRTVFLCLKSEWCGFSLIVSIYFFSLKSSMWLLGMHFFFVSLPLTLVLNLHFHW